MAKAKKPREPEYTLNIFRGTDPKTRQEGWIFFVRTIKEFMSFDYEIILSAAIQDHSITLTISGIHAPLLVMPGVGPAKGIALLKDLHGSYSLTVKKLNKEVNIFKITFGPGGAQVRERPPHPFIAVAAVPLPVQ